VTCVSGPSDKFAVCMAATDRTRLADCLTATTTTCCDGQPAVKAPVRIHCRRRQTIKPNSPTGGLTAFARSSIVRVPGLSSEPARPVHATKARSSPWRPFSFLAFSGAPICIQRVQLQIRLDVRTHYLFCVNVAHPGRRGTGSGTPAAPCPVAAGWRRTDGRTATAAWGGRVEEKWEVAVDVSAWRSSE